VFDNALSAPVVAATKLPLVDEEVDTLLAFICKTISTGGVAI
jgi:hypothetical protein